MNILFLGYVVPPEEVDRYSGISIAGNKMQWNVIKNLSEYNDVNITCLTLAPIAVFPHDKKLYQHKENINFGKKITGTRVKFLNMPILKQFSQIIHMWSEVKKILKNNSDTIVVGYNMFPQIGVIIRRIKKRYKEVETVCLLADLPIDDNKNRSVGSKVLRFFFDKSTKKNLCICDKYIVLNKYVGNVCIGGKKYIVIDGGVDEQDILRKRMASVANKKNILFSGALSEYNGIVNLIKAMTLIKSNDVSLDIYGGGYLEEWVRKQADILPNISYYGRISNEAVMKKQQEAWLLINPRPINDAIAKVTFPSKTFEYMLSGTPILATKLEAYGEEYNDKLFFIEGDTPEVLAEAIDRVHDLDDDTLLQTSNRAQQFVIEEKSWKNQTKKIYGFLKHEF